MSGKHNCVVIVATIKALKLHGGVEYADLLKENLEALKKGCENLKQHANAISKTFKLPFIITLNTFTTDTEKEISVLKKLFKEISFKMKSGQKVVKVELSLLKKLLNYAIRKILLNMLMI